MVAEHAAAQDRGALAVGETPIALQFGNTPDYDPAANHGGITYWPSGDPNGAGREPWPRYDETEPTLLFDLQNSVAREVDRGACEFWRGLPYLRPAYP